MGGPERRHARDGGASAGLRSGPLIVSDTEALLADETPESLQQVLVAVADLTWPEGRSPELVALARRIDNRSLVEALDQPGPARLGAIRLLGLLR